MNTIASTLLGLCQMIMAPVSSGGGCLINDAFTNWSGIWTAASANASAVSIAHVDSRMYVYSHSGLFSDSMPFAAGMSWQWAMDMTQDWAISARWHVNPSTPTLGEAGVAFVLMLEGNPDTMYMHRAWTVRAGTYNNYQVPNSEQKFLSSEYWINGAGTIYDSVGSRPDEFTMYIWWDAASNTIRANTVLYLESGAFTRNLAGLSSQQQAWIGFGGFVKGPWVAAFSNDMWIDDICLIEGNTVGGLVGACCLGETCAQLPQAACQGTFRGFNVDCDDCLCLPEPACAGDVNGDMLVNVTDLDLFLQAWGSTLCLYDVDDTGLVGMQDLITLLMNWGPC
ncbi:MAG: hypothetical protein MK101_07975 [Phycisphaerales bacterium]|nr:hypothetical protein [Phycisphaerales bacterium]